MKKENKDFLVIGLALFAMFFGAGNLIFPPSIGLQAGENWFAAMMGFYLTGIGMPLLGILAISKAGGTIEGLAGKVGSKFSKVFGSVAVLILGPLLGVPRTGATTYEMGIKPIFSDVSPVLVSIVFFSVTLFFVIKPSGIIDRIGKLLTPILLIMLSVIIYKGVTAPMGTPIDTGMLKPFSTGFTEGYQTMDAIVSILIGGIVIASLKEKGYEDKRQQFKLTAKAGILAATGLAIVYGGLLYLGATGSSVFPQDIVKTGLTVSIVTTILGEIGKAVLGICVSCACLTTSVGITATVGDYFSKITEGKLSYKSVVIASSIISAIVSNTGVEQIVKFAAPILAVIYPVALVLIIMNLFDNLIVNKRIYKGAVYGTLCISIIDGITALGVDIGIVKNIVAILPLGKQGFGWILPALIGIVIVNTLTKKNEERRKRKYA